MSKISMEHAMTVAQTIEFLKGLPQDAYVILSSDEEGNSFSPLTNSVGYGLYEAESTWSGNWIDLGDPHYENGESGFDKDNAHKAVFLFPVN